MTFVLIRILKYRNLLWNYFVLSLQNFPIIFFCLSQIRWEKGTSHPFQPEELCPSSPLKSSLKSPPTALSFPSHLPESIIFPHYGNSGLSRQSASRSLQFSILKVLQIAQLPSLNVLISIELVIFICKLSFCSYCLSSITSDFVVYFLHPKESDQIIRLSQIEHKTITFCKGSLTIACLLEKKI